MKMRAERANENCIFKIIIAPRKLRLSIDTLLPFVQGCQDDHSSIQMATFVHVHAACGHRHVVIMSLLEFNVVDVDFTLDKDLCITLDKIFRSMAILTAAWGAPP